MANLTGHAVRRVSLADARPEGGGGRFGVAWRFRPTHRRTTSRPNQLPVRGPRNWELKGDDAHDSYPTRTRRSCEPSNSQTSRARSDPSLIETIFVPSCSGSHSLDAYAVCFGSFGYNMDRLRGVRPSSGAVSACFVAASLRTYTGGPGYVGA
eukprot:8853925-Pyramimonas_sp.AAC.3